jgi:hypothetical protein
MSAAGISGADKTASGHQAGIEHRHQSLFEIVWMQPMTVRRVFYQASVRGIVGKAAVT